jgi:hypothetical protein
MTAQTPEQWWGTLDEDDRNAYLDAVGAGLLPEALWLKMRAAGIVVSEWTLPKPVRLMPTPFWQFIRDRARQRHV